jgi:tetratricopeptide (TPR) repeat protein
LTGVFRKDQRFAFALTALRRRDFGTAEAALTTLLEDGKLRAADLAFLFNKRGVACIGLERRELAARDFEAALEAQPGYVPALTNLANLLFESGEVDAAIARYERAIALDADYAVAYLNLGAAYKRAGRLDDAVRALRQAERLERRAKR